MRASPAGQKREGAWCIIQVSMVSLTLCPQTTPRPANLTVCRRRGRLCISDRAHTRPWQLSNNNQPSHPPAQERFECTNTSDDRPCHISPAWHPVRGSREGQGGDFASGATEVGATRKSEPWSEPRRNLRPLGGAKRVETVRVRRDVGLLERCPLPARFTLLLVRSGGFFVLSGIALSRARILGRTRGGGGGSGGTARPRKAMGVPPPHGRPHFQFDLLMTRASGCHE